MAALKFSVSRKINLVDVKDGAGNSTQLPHCGSFNYKETQAIEKLIQEGIRENYRAEFVAAILKIRLKKEDPDIVNKSTEELLSSEDGEPIPNSLLNAMYTFFDNERREWLPDTQRLQLRGDDAVGIAINYAKEHQLAAVQRSDMVDNKIVFVVDDISKLEAETQLNNFVREQSINAAIESGNYDITKIVELNREYYTWEILANYLPEVKKPKALPSTGKETIGA
ncbi:MAG: hypothetical protein ACRDBG_17925 [Waterburya sp.]